MRVFRINTSKIYNAENRPVRWESGDTVVTMDFDRMGRRVFYKEEVNGVITKHHKFVYDRRSNDAMNGYYNFGNFFPVTRAASGCMSAEFFLWKEFQKYLDSKK